MRRVVDGDADGPLELGPDPEIIGREGLLVQEHDVAQAEANLATTLSQVPTLERSLKQAVHRFGVLLGQDPAALLPELSNEAPIPGIPPEVPVGLPSDLLRRRPDVRRAER